MGAYRISIDADVSSYLESESKLEEDLKAAEKQTRMLKPSESYRVKYRH